MNIVIKRSGALGDVLCITPVIARIRKQYPDSYIAVATAYPNVFEGNPHVNDVNKSEVKFFDRVIDLDMAHERRRDIHAIDSYMEVAFGDHGEGFDKSIVFTYPPTEPLFEKFAVLHANKSWPNRTMPWIWWDKVSDALNDKGYLTVAVGTDIDYCPRGAYDYRSKYDLQEQAGVIDQADVFICGASGLFILAAATDTPTVVPMTINTPETCLPWRHDVLGWGYYPLIATTPCLGCNHEQGPVTSVGCWSIRKDLTKPDYACIDTISAEAAVEMALMGAKHERTTNWGRRV